MANKYLDNFSLSTNLSDYENLWLLTNTSGNSFNITISYNATLNKTALNFGGSEYGTGVVNLRFTDVSAKTVFIGSRIVLATDGIGGSLFFVAPNAASNGGVRFNSDNSVSLFNASGEVVATSSPQTVIPNLSYFMELECVSDPTAGELIVRVGGVVVAQASNINTDGSGVALNAGFGCSVPAYSHLMSCTDMYLNDSSGDSWNSFMGDIAVQTIIPTAASVSELTPVGNSTNAANAAQISPNASNYNFTTTVGQRDIYVGNPLASNTAEVLMVVQRSMAYTTPGGTHSFENILIFNGTEQDGSPHDMTVTNVSYEDRTYVNPASGNPLSVSDINAIQFGAELLS